MSLENLFSNNSGILNTDDLFPQSTSFPAFPNGANIGSTPSYIDQYVSQFVVMKDFESINSDYITANYFKDVKPKLLNNILIVQEPDCDTDLVPRNLTLQRGPNNVIAKIIVYVSKNADKLERLYDCVADQVKEDEIIFFLQYNSENNNDQILYVRFGAEKLKNDLLGVSDTELSEISPLFDATLFRELIAYGKIKTKKTILGLLVKSFIGIGSVIFAIPKVLGWVSSQIGKVISENLKIPERIWNSQSPDYFLDEKNILKNLRIDPSFMNGLHELIGNDPNVAPIMFLPVGGDLIKQNLGVVDSLVREYNIYIEERVKEWEGLKDTAGFYITEEIAYLSGIWNGLVDFVADIFNFVGLVLQTPYDLINNFQSFLNALRNLYGSWEKFSFTEFFITSLRLKLDIDKEVYKFLKSKNPRAEYNFDKLAYFSGYGIAFLASLLVPGSEFSQLASIAKATKFIPKGFLECLVQQSSKNIRGSQAFISFINEIATFLGKKGNELYTELKKNIDNIVKWFEGNKKEFEKALNEIPSLTTPELEWMATRRTSDLGGEILKVSQLRKLRTILREKGVQLIVEGDQKSITKLFKVVSIEGLRFDSLDDLLYFMHLKNYKGGFDAYNKQMILPKNATEIIVFHEMAHVKHFEEVGELTYLSLSTLDKEMYVWEQIFNNRRRWTEKELGEALWYINSELKKAGVSDPIKIH